MNTLFLASSQAGGSNMFMIIAFIIIAAIMYFGMVRPQKKQQQKRMEMMNKLQKGDKVILVDGLHAKIDSVNNDDNTVVVDADGIYLTFSRMAVRQIIPAEKTTNSDTVKESKANETSDTKEAEAKVEKTEPKDQEKQSNEAEKETNQKEK